MKLRLLKNESIRNEFEMFPFVRQVRIWVTEKQKQSSMVLELLLSPTQS